MVANRAAAGRGSIVGFTTTGFFGVDFFAASQQHPGAADHGAFSAATMSTYSTNDAIDVGDRLG